MDYSEAEEIKEGNLSAVKVYGVRHTDVGKIFDCGQCFRFEPVADTQHAVEYAGAAFGRFVSFAQDGDTLTIYNSDISDFNNIWRGYLCLHEDYDKYLDGIREKSDNPALEKAIKYGDGIRIISQEAWECVCSFIISQNNNIPRIKKLVEALSRECGEKINTEGMENHGAKSDVYSFPSAEKVLALGVDGLAALKTGFRAKYIYDAAERVTDGRLDLSALYSCPKTQDMIDALCEVKGIGLKVASCIALFGYARYDAFPIDVWIRRVLAEYFPAGFDPTELGSVAGIAQQYLFYYERYLNGGKG